MQTTKTITVKTLRRLERVYDGKLSITYTLNLWDSISNRWINVRTKYQDVEDMILSLHGLGIYGYRSKNEITGDCVTTWEIPV